MVSTDVFAALALSFPKSEEHPHFQLRSFRVGKKIFSTLWEKENKAMVKLPLIEQSVFCSFDVAVFYPVPGAWGKKGATFVNLSKVRKDMLRDAMTIAYEALVNRSGEEASRRTGNKKVGRRGSPT